MGKRVYHQDKAIPEIVEESDSVQITRELVHFWRDVMKGVMTTTLNDGRLTDGIIPIEQRLKASELLAKYVAPPAPKRPAQKAKADMGSASVTPAVLKIAEKIESDPSSDIDQLLHQVFKDQK